MSTKTIVALAFGLTLAVASLAAAPAAFAITVFTPLSGDFNLGTNWSGGVPGNNNTTNVNAIVQTNTQVATTTGDYNASTAAVNFDWNLVPRSGATVNIDHNLQTSATLGAKAGNIFLSTSSGTATVNQAAGTTVTTGGVFIGQTGVTYSGTQFGDYNLLGTLDATLIDIRTSGKLFVGATGSTDDPITVNAGTAGSITSSGSGGTLSGAVALSSSADFRGGGNRLTFSGGINSAANESLSLNLAATVDTNPIDLNAGVLTITSNGNLKANATQLNVGGNDWQFARINFGGYLLLGGTDFMPTDAGVEFGWHVDSSSSGTLDLNGFDQTVTYLRQTTIFPTVNGDQNVTGGGTLTINNSIDSDYHGRITDGATPTSIVKTGTGTQIFNNQSGTPNNYTGPTSVNAGQLSLETSLTSTVTVASGATLATETQTVATTTGDIDLLDGGSAQFTLFSDPIAGGAGAGVPGTDQSAWSAANFDLGDITVNFIEDSAGLGLTLDYGDEFDLLDWTGGLVLSGTTTFNLPTLAPNLGWDTSRWATAGILAVVPEPSSFALMLLGLAGLSLRRRRR